MKRLKKKKGGARGGVDVERDGEEECRERRRREDKAREK